jgi:hypothetical protein
VASHVGTTLNARSISLDELVGALGVELLSPLQTRKLFIPRSDKTDKNGRNTQPRYTAGTPRATGYPHSNVFEARTAD